MRKGRGKMQRREYEIKVWVSQMLLRFINRERNQEFLKTHPHIPVNENLALSFLVMDIRNKRHIEFSDADEGFMEKMWGKPVKELYPLVLENTMRLLPPSLIPLEELLEEIVKDRGMHLEELQEGFPKMYVLTNLLKRYGAAALLYPGTLKKAGEALGSDFAILPSSIHEVILLPGEFGRKDLENFADMVRYVNREHVEDCDVLDDTVYFYKRDGDRLFRPLEEEP